MPTASFTQRRDALEAYFDRTAAEAWTQLTSNAPVSKIRATVRAGRDEMRALLLSWLPGALQGARVFDAGCGTGALAVEAANRGAAVTAVDVAPNLLDVAKKRAPATIPAERLSFHAGDMLSAAYGETDHVVAMDSLIHYRLSDMVDALASLTERATTSVVFTFAPRTPALSLMHLAGQLFPRADRAPAIEPVPERALRRALETDPRFTNWRVGRTQRVSSGFYTSQAMKLTRK